MHYFTETRVYLSSKGEPEISQQCKQKKKSGILNGNLQLLQVLNKTVMFSTLENQKSLTKPCGYTKLLCLNPLYFIVAFFFSLSFQNLSLVTASVS